MRVINQVVYTVLITLAMHPVMLAILIPYMYFVVGLSESQLILWIWTGVPVGMALNAVLAVYLKLVNPKLIGWINRLVP